MPKDLAIVILVYNERTTLETNSNHFIRIIKNKKCRLIFIDSGSTDGSREYLNKIKGQLTKIEIIDIPKVKFNYGLTRNEAVKLSHCSLICFVSGDAILKSINFINYFLNRFNQNKRVVAIFGKQKPYSETSLFNKIEHEARFLALEQTRNTTEFWQYFISNSFVCYRRSFLLKHPFPEADYSEDLLMGKQIVDNGYIKVYDPRCVIYHSHNYSFKEYLDIQFKSINVKVNRLKIKQPLMLIPKLKLLIKTKATLKDKLVCLLIFGITYVIKLFIYLKLKLSSKA